MFIEWTLKQWIHLFLTVIFSLTNVSLRPQSIHLSGTSRTRSTVSRVFSIAVILNGSTLNVRVHRCIASSPALFNDSSSGIKRINIDKNYQVSSNPRKCISYDMSNRFPAGGVELFFRVFINRKMSKSNLAIPEPLANEAHSGDHSGGASFCQCQLFCFEQRW